MPPVPPAKSVLVYSGLELIGDGIIKLPFIRTLRAAFPEARLTWLAGKGRTVYAHELAPLVEGLLDEVIEEAGIGLRLAELLAPRPLGARRFDLVIDTQSRVLTTLILRRLRHGRFVSPAARFLLSDIRPRGRYRKPGHLNQRLLDLIQLATGAPPPKPAPRQLPEPASGVAGGLLPAGACYVGLLPGAGDRRKCWPLDRFVQLARIQSERGRIPVFILGPAEAEWQEPLAAAVPEARFPNQEAAGAGLSPGPLLTVALGSRLAAAVANDSGGGHLIAEGGAPLVSLFGPSAAEKFRPLATRLELVTAQAFGGDSMDLIPLEAVSAALEALLVVTD